MNVELTERDIPEMAHAVAPSFRKGVYTGGTAFSCITNFESIFLRKLLKNLGYKVSTCRLVNFTVDDEYVIEYLFHSSFPYSRWEELVESTYEDSDWENGSDSIIAEDVQGER